MTCLRSQLVTNQVRVQIRACGTEAWALSSMSCDMSNAAMLNPNLTEDYVLMIVCGLFFLYLSSYSGVHLDSDLSHSRCPMATCSYWPSYWTVRVYRFFPDCRFPLITCSVTTEKQEASIENSQTTFLAVPVTIQKSP